MISAIRSNPYFPFAMISRKFRLASAPTILQLVDTIRGWKTRGYEMGRSVLIRIYAAFLRL